MTIPPHRYCPDRQIAVTLDGLGIPPTGTGQKTNPDGDPKNPPPWDTED